MIQRTSSNPLQFYAFMNVWARMPHAWVSHIWGINKSHISWLKSVDETFFHAYWLAVQTWAATINPDPIFMNSGFGFGCPDHKWRSTSSRYSTYVRRWTAFSPHQPKVIQYWHPPQGVKQSMDHRPLRSTWWQWKICPSHLEACTLSLGRGRYHGFQVSHVRHVGHISALRKLNITVKWSSDCV